MTLGTKARILVRVVTTVVATVAHFPARYAPVVRLAVKHPVWTTARFCYDIKHVLFIIVSKLLQ